MKIFCSNCGTENKSTNIKCEYCGNVINEGEEVKDIDVEEYMKEYKKLHSNPLTEEEKKAAQKATKTFLTVFVVIFLIIFLVPFFMIGIVFTTISSSFGKIEDEVTSGYIQTEAYLIKYTEPNSNDAYKGIYEYEVDGEKYTITSNFASNVRSMFDEDIIVKYNPQNPEIATIVDDDGLAILGGIGTIFLSVPVFIIIIVIIIFVIVKRNKNKVKRV